MKLLSLLPILFFLGQSVVSGPPQAPFTLEQVLSAPFTDELVSSPDGRRFAWILNERGKRNVWVAQSPQFVPRRITGFSADDGLELSGLTWTPDSEILVFVRGQGTNNSGESPNPAHTPDSAEQSLWVVPFSAAGPRKIAAGAEPAISSSGMLAFVSEGQICIVPVSRARPAKQLLSARGRASSPTWSPDGKSLAFVSNRDDHSFIGVFRTDTRSLVYLAPSVDRDWAPRWSPDGNRIAFIRQPGRGGDGPPPGAERPDPWAIMVADIARPGVATEVWGSGPTLDASLPRTVGENVLQWAADGRLVFVSEHDGWARLYSIAAAGRVPLLLTPGEGEVEQIAVSGDRRTVFYTSNVDDPDRRHIWRVPATGGSPVQLTSGPAIEWSPAPLADGSVAFLRSDARLPGMPHVCRNGSTDPVPIARELIPRDFPGGSMVLPQQVTFRSADGLTIHAQLFVPESAPSETRRPAVIYMHGGPVRQMLLGWHYMYYYHNCYAMNQFLAGRGYTVLSVNFRSGTGYGRAFREAAGRGPRGAAEYQDIVAAAKYLRARPDVDSKRIGLWGGSYGGYLTALGLARNSDLFAAGVDLHGVHDWSARQFRSSGGTDSPEVIRKARDSSPIASVERWKSAVLLIHGDDDRNVDFSQTVDLVQRLRAQKVEFEQIVFPDEVHDFLLHRSWLQAYAAAADFFDRHLRK